jgi:hypothetical protein
LGACSIRCKCIGALGRFAAWPSKTAGALCFTARAIEINLGGTFAIHCKCLAALGQFAFWSRETAGTLCFTARALDIIHWEGVFSTAGHGQFIWHNETAEANGCLWRAIRENTFAIG